MTTTRLKDIRKEQGLLQKDLAAHLGITQQAYANYESGKREPDYDTLAKLADIFNVSVDYLLGRTDDPTPPNIKKERSPEEKRRLEVIKEAMLPEPRNEEELAQAKLKLIAEIGKWDQDTILLMLDKIKELDSTKNNAE